MRTSAQGVLGIGSSGVIGLPDTTYYGDTLDNMSVWLVNQGPSLVTGILVELQAAPNLLGVPIPIGSLDLLLTILGPGDSISVPLDYFVVSPQNSNNGSNIMVIWPTAPGITPGDSTDDTYWVGGATGISGNAAPEPAISFFPNPSKGLFQVQLPAQVGHHAEISVFQVDGKLLEQRTIETFDFLDLSHLQDGLYFYEVRSASGFFEMGGLLIRK